MADLERLLERTSRTFALNIPYLPEPTRAEVTIAYLLFRIADTFEDSVWWSADHSIRALMAFAELLETPEPARARALAEAWTEKPPLDHAGYIDLLAATPEVLVAFEALPDGAKTKIRGHVVRTAEGMAKVVSRSGDERRLVLADLPDLRDYCYIVAGIVGEMLTELFLLDQPVLVPLQPQLRAWAPQFGEGLQLTNILKDAQVDAEEGRLFLPPEVDRGAVFELAHSDLDIATEYTLSLQEAGADRGLVTFNALPVALARATLDKVARRGPGAKISRPELWARVKAVEKALDRDEPVLQRSPAHSRRTTTFTTTDQTAH